MGNDNNNIKSEMYRLSQTRNLSNLLVSENELFIKSDIDNISYGTTENLIIFKILYGELNPNCSYFKQNNINPLTMIIVDFFEFESIYSNIYGGYNPKYHLFCQYKIKMDDFFLEYIENDFISIDFVQKLSKNKTKLQIISNNKISLKNLLITPDSCIQNEIELISNDNNDEYIGKLSFIAKMLRSVDIDHHQITNNAKQNQKNTENEKKSSASPQNIQHKEDNQELISPADYSIHQDINNDELEELLENEIETKQDIVL